MPDALTISAHIFSPKHFLHGFVVSRDRKYHFLHTFGEALSGECPRYPQLELGDEPGDVELGAREW